MKFLRLHLLRAAPQVIPQQLVLLSFCKILSMLDEATVCFNSWGWPTASYSIVFLLFLSYISCTPPTVSQLLVRGLRTYSFGFAVPLLTILEWHQQRYRKAPASHSELNKAIVKPPSGKSHRSQNTKLESNATEFRLEDPEPPVHYKGQRLHVLSNHSDIKDLMLQRSFILITNSSWNKLISSYKIMHTGNKFWKLHSIHKEKDEAFLPSQKHPFPSLWGDADQTPSRNTSFCQWLTNLFHLSALRKKCLADKCVGEGGKKNPEADVFKNWIFCSEKYAFSFRGCKDNHPDRAKRKPTWCCLEPARSKLQGVWCCWQLWRAAAQGHHRAPGSSLLLLWELWQQGDVGNHVNPVSASRCRPLKPLAAAGTGCLLVTWKSYP